MDELIKEEIKRRQDLFKSLTTTNNAREISPKKLRSLNIYGGAAGIWTHKSLTSKVTNDSRAIAVSVLHTGQQYQDDFNDSGIFYHFPNTNRKGATDNNEIQALQTCADFDIPIFTIVTNEDNLKLRDVYFGKITLMDYNSKVALIEFQKWDSQFNNIKDSTSPFKTMETQKHYESTVNKKYRNPRFRIEVLKKYGVKCCACNINYPELLDAAHIISKKSNGVDDPRNGLPFCATHHRAYDAGFFTICPETYEFIKTKNKEFLFKDLNFVYHSLNHMKSKPHRKALEIAYKKFNK